MLARSGVHDLAAHSPANPSHLLFLYLGRRGLGRFTLELARTVAELPHVRATFCVSRQNEIFPAFADVGCRVLPVDTFDSVGGALTRGYRVRTLYRNVLGELTRQRSTGVVTLMPHIWTPLVAPLIRRHGYRYLTVIHDAHPHPGDPTSLLNGWALRDAHHADPVVTLSRSVADALVATGTVSRQRLVPLFHPDLGFPHAGVGTEGSDRTSPQQAVAWPFRLLFFGRILAYKGLPALVSAMEMLRAEGVPVELGVFGDGQLGPLRPRLQAIGAEIENRWIADHEVAGILARYHAVALSHNECSQSGVAAVALGAGLPVIGSGVGGLGEQVRDGLTGVLARDGTPASLAAAVRRLAADRKLYASIRTHIHRTRWERSMRRFAEHLVSLATDTVAVPRQEVRWV
ncbi:MAG TPA: glycosyltransferase family 4 protein [Hyphomicrobiaceae bacterium]|nr:glycosyltransferase family 4 protein [Hyphomicrobiaceae bacterium]